MLIALLLMTGCASQGSAKSDVDVQRVHMALLEAGLDTAWMTLSPDAARDAFFAPDAEPAAMKVNGAMLQLFIFDAPGRAAAASAAVSPEGLRVPEHEGTAYVTWAGSPHFFCRGRLIALYVERATPGVDAATDDRILSVLRTAMGEQFADYSAVGQ